MMEAHEYETGEKVSDSQLPALKDRAEKYGEMNARKLLISVSSFIGFLIVFTAIMVFASWTESEEIPKSLVLVFVVIGTIIFSVTAKKASARQQSIDNERDRELQNSM